MKLDNKPHKDVLKTMNKTLITARLFDGFWDRWLIHGVEKKELDSIRNSLSTVNDWNIAWKEKADKKLKEAKESHRLGFYQDAEIKFRTASLYYQLIQWLIPERQKEKMEWLQVSLDIFAQADRVSNIETKYIQLPLENQKCFGRVRIPTNPKGVIIIINPIDSTKEELFTYEMDFANGNFITISFDGPGQGQTFIHGLKATQDRWKNFIDLLINFSSTSFPHLPVHLFGTSSGASWAVYGSCNPKVDKVVAVSPAFINENITLAEYFIERKHFVLEEGESEMLPSLEDLSFIKPVFLIHGKQDVMVSEDNINDLYKKLPDGKYFKAYEDEGHCCNFKLPEIRQLTIKWLEKGIK